MTFDEVVPKVLVNPVLVDYPLNKIEFKLNSKFLFY
jgi:hypothetical protein